MTDHELAQQLLAAIGPAGESVRSAITAGEDLIAIAELAELAAAEAVSLPADLLAEVGTRVRDGPTSALDADDIAYLNEDLSILERISRL